MRFPVPQLLVSICVTVSITSPAHGENGTPLTFRTVALQGDLLPGASGPLSSFQLPINNENGRVAFIGTAGGTQIIWKETETGLEPVIHAEDEAPGTSGQTFEGFEDLNLNDAGHVAFTASLLEAPVQSTSGIWAENDTGIAKAAQRGEVGPVEEDPENRFLDRPFDQDISTIFPFAFNNQGQVVFYSELRLADMSFGGAGVFRFANSSLQSVYATRFPGTGTGLTEISNNNTLSDNGSVGVVTRDLDGQEVSGGSRQEETAPGTEGAEFLSFSPPDINSTGQHVFRATLKETDSADVTSENDSAIYITTPEPALIARENSAAPGTGVVFNDMSASPLINDAGHVVFENPLRGAAAGERWGIWTTAGTGTLRLVLQAGDPVPDTEAGTTFKQSTSLPVAKTMIINHRDNLAFVAQMEGPAVDEANDTGLFAEIHGELALILREGDQLEVAPNDLRTISSFSASDDIGIAGGTGNGDGRRSSFNNQDQLTFAATFTDGTAGIFAIDDVELAIAGKVLRPELGINNDGHPTVTYTVIPGFEYSIERAPELVNPNDAVLVLEPSVPPARERRRFTDASIDFDAGGIVISSVFYFLRYEKEP